jgi:hypothetical protein
MIIVYQTSSSYYVKASYIQKGVLLKKCYYRQFDGREKQLSGYLFFIFNFQS